MNETVYTAPAIAIVDVMVERGYDVSAYGEAGDAGQQSLYLDTDGFYL